MKKNKFPFLLMTMLSSLVLSSCQNNKLDVSIFIYNNDTFVSSLIASLETRLDEAELTYSTHNAELSQIKQNEAIVSAIDQDASSLLLINLVDRLSASAIIEKAATKNKSIIFFNREPLLQDMKKGLEGNQNLYYVGTNPSFEGQAQAEMISSLFSSPDNLNSFYDKNGDGIIQTVLIKGEIGHQDTENRCNAVLESLAELGYKTEVLSSTYCDWDKQLAFESMLEIYENFSSEIELVISNNDDMAIGAIDAMVQSGVFKEEESYLQPFPVLGVDGTEIGLNYIERGLMFGTVKNEGSKQADAIYRLAEAILNNSSIDSSFPYSINEENHSIYCLGEGIVSSKDNFKFPES